MLRGVAVPAVPAVPALSALRRAHPAFKTDLLFLDHRFSSSGSELPSFILPSSSQLLSESPRLFVLSPGTECELPCFGPQPSHSLPCALSHLTTPVLKASSLEMGEVLAVSGSVAGLLTLGGAVCGGLVQYYDCWKNKDQEVKDICRALDGLNKTFTMLSDKLKRLPFGADVVLRVTESITACKVGIQALESRLEKFKSTKPGIGYQLRRAQYPFKEKTLRKLKGMVKDLRGDLQLALSALGIEASAASFQKLKIVDGKVDHLASTSAAASNKILKGVADIQTAHYAQAERAADSRTSAIASWLSPLNFEAKQNDVFSRRQADTGRWFLEKTQFRAWLAGSEKILWCPGMRRFPPPSLRSAFPLEISLNSLFVLTDRDAHIAGAGKTILA